MKNTLRHRALVLAAIASSIAFSSCTYDPAYTSYGGSYSSGYGDGYGYGGSSFNTSLFVSTGNPRWGYDPYCYSYYDYHRRCYYDPYLNGYYPVGYRPPAVVGCPHPHGWRPGSGYCPPPRYVSSVTVVNYRNRETLYRNSNYDWAKQVRQRPIGGKYPSESHPPRNSGYNGSRQPSYQGKPGRYEEGRNPYGNSGNRPGRYEEKPSRYDQPGRHPSTYANKPIRYSEPRGASASGGKRKNPQSEMSGPKPGRREEGRREQGKAPKNEKQKNIRGLGQG